MHFSRETQNSFAGASLCRVASWRLLLAAPCWCASPIDPHVHFVHCGSRQLLLALLYLLHPCSRPRGGYSDSVLALRASLWLLSPLRFGSLHLLPWMACMLFSPKAPTVGAGAKNSHGKITIFRGALSLFFDAPYIEIADSVLRK